MDREAVDALSLSARHGSSNGSRLPASSIPANTIRPVSNLLSSEESDRGNVDADLANSVNYLPDPRRVDNVTIEVDVEAIEIFFGGPLGD
jgi:hypothetical protein